MIQSILHTFYGQRLNMFRGISYSVLRTTYYIPVLTLCFLTASTFTVLLSSGASAQSPPVTPIRITPLKYEEQLELGAEKTGYVDVSNPGDTNITIKTQVQAFRQMNIEGDLEFYDDERIQKAIQMDLREFELGPREAARVFFDINSNQLPEGGVYAAVLFAAEESRGDDRDNLERSAINIISRVGTLLILENGDKGVKRGSISKLGIPFWQFGAGIDGDVEFTADKGERSIAFEPQLKTSIPIAGEKETETGLVFAGNTRQFSIGSHGDYLGIFPVKVTDEVTGSIGSSWVLAVTGIWRTIAPLFLLVIMASILLQRYFLHRQSV